MIGKRTATLRATAAGRREKGKHALRTLVIYFLLIGIGFVYLYPILYMVLISVMPTSDLINPTIQWIPTAIEWESFTLVYRVLDYSHSVLTTILLASVSAALQTMTCALAGYALARYPVPWRKLWTLLLLIVFILPADVIAVPRYVLFTQYQLVGSLQSVFLPALLGQGLKSSLFILLFMQSFASYPSSYDEAAQLDGAGHVRIFLRIALPLALPIILLSLLFSFVWYWNETAQTGMYLAGAYKTLPLQLEQFDSTFGRMMQASVGSEANRLNERIQMAATILAISPLCILYLFFQKGMIRSIESAGITGE